MFGTYTPPFHLEYREGFIETTADGNALQYHRRFGSDSLDKTIATRDARMIVTPVEPLNLPKEVTRYLEIRFPVVIVEPDSDVTVYLTFPIEIGIFVEGKGDTDLIDIISSARQKYSLYGPPDAGVITRYHESPLSFEPPDVDPLRDGVLTLTLKNSGRAFVEVSCVVLDGVGMVIGYVPGAVRPSGMKAVMTIISGIVAETTVLGQRFPEGGRERAVPLYMTRPLVTGKNVVVVEKKGLLSTREVFIADKKTFLMQFGLG